MSHFVEFLDENLHRAYPLTDESGGHDITDAFTLSTALLSDIYLCVPNIPDVDKTKFYIENVLIRRYYIDITIGYDDPDVTRPLGVFKNISTTAAVHSTYDFIPTEFQSEDAWAPLYHMTGQVIIGDTGETTKHLGSWSFDPVDDAHSTYLESCRIAKGLLNVQYISINDRLFTGQIRLREGNNIVLETAQRPIAGGDTETVITISASLNAGSPLQLTNEADVLSALIDRYGVPLRSINGMLPNVERNFVLLGEDCTTVDPSGDHSIVIGNPCASPCCDEDANITALLESIANLNLRYAQLKAFLDSTASSVDSLQNKLLVLGSEV